MNYEGPNLKLAEKSEGGVGTAAVCSLIEWHGELSESQMSFVGLLQICVGTRSRLRR